MLNLLDFLITFDEIRILGHYYIAGLEEFV